MVPASAIALVFSVVAACAAAFNGWIFWLRRSQTAHLWLAVAAVGIAGLGIFTALLYEASDPIVARRWQLFLLACSAPLILGFVRFSIALLQIERPGLVWRGGGLATAALVLAAWPNAFFSSQNISRRSLLVGSEYFSAEITLVGTLFLVAVLAVFLELLTLFARHSDRLGDESKVLIAMLAVWFVTGVNDIAVGLGLYDGPMLVVVGYAGFLMGFTAVLTRRMTGSMEQIEESAQALQAQAEERTEELRERETQLARGEEMATIGALAAGVAREIDTPIAQVGSSFKRLVALRHEHHAISEVREVLGECRQGVERIRSIVSDLLELAQQSAGEHEPLDLRDVIESALPILSREARSRAVLVRDYAEIPPVLGDPHQLGQVVLNLVANALQAIPEGDPEGNRVTVSTRDHLGVVQLIIEDTGPGIPEDIRPRIFDPFFTTRASSGTGLGLALTHELIQRHRGQISLDSGAEGTTATVSFPPMPEATGDSSEAELAPLP